MPPEVIKSMVNWCNRGNPSANYPSAVAARNMLDEFRAYLGKLCPSHRVIFTSGASESNCTAIQCITAAYAQITERIPHVIISAIEHKSIISTVTSLEERGKITLSRVYPRTSGCIAADDIAKLMRPETALVCVMSANNETGAINDIIAIRDVVNGSRAIFHCDMVQTMGKFPADCFDSAAISFHKMQGPPGVGALLIKQSLLDGWEICPLIFGSQNSSYRGGTENVPGIGASFTALKMTLTDRRRKNAHLIELKKLALIELRKRLPVQRYIDYVQAPNRSAKIVVFGDWSPAYLPGVLLLSYVDGVDVCNTQMKDALCKRGVIVSIGSACNTASKSASHVLDAMNADDAIRRGTLRVSFGDNNTVADAKTFARELLDIIATGQHIRARSDKKKSD